jgi:gluconokinase
MVLVVMGVTGSGKTTIGKLVAEKLQRAFYDADDFHPPANIKKMSAGIPLTDQDRVAWLDALAALIGQCLAENRPAIVACSALKSNYRERLQAPTQIEPERVQFVYLHITPEVARQRLSARKNHFMPPTLIDSQFATLEEPDDAIVVDATRMPAEVVAEILQKIPT